MIHLLWCPVGTERGTERIEAFSDGVFAIAITLLILEIKLPSHTGSFLPLSQQLLAQWPSYFAYILSFVVIGIYWANHHYLFMLFRQTNHTLNLLNLFLLMCISFLPFPTAILGNYLQDPVNQTCAATFYALGLLLPATAWCLVWLYGSRHLDIIDTKLTPAFIRSLTGQYLFSIGLYLVATLVCLFNVQWGLFLCVGLTLLYLLPPKQPQYKETGN